MTDKKDFIAKKMKILKKEGYSNPQAFAIAMSYLEKEKAQQGTEYYQVAGMFQTPNINLQAQSMSPQQDFRMMQVNTDLSLFEEEERARKIAEMTQWGNTLDQGTPQKTEEEIFKDMYADAMSAQAPNKGNGQDPIYNDRYNLMNPYSGISLESALNFTGNAFGEGNTGMGVAGAGLSLLKGGRNFLTGFASGKENKRMREEYMTNRFEYDPNFQMAQQGGTLTNSEYLTGQFIADEGNGNINLEGKEYVRRYNTGNVQEVVGEPHIKNGKKAEGVNANLEQGDKVLSDYTKIPAKDIKELKERYQLTLKKGATFADAQKAFDKKLGIPKITEELSTDIEKFGKNNSVKDETAKRLNEMAIAKQIEDKKAKLEALKDPQSMVFEDLFKRQEALPKLGNGKTLYDKNGKEVTETNTTTAQQGGSFMDIATKYGISAERAEELIRMQMGGMQQEQDPMQQVFEAISQMIQQGLAPEQIAQQLIGMGVPPEQVPQLIEQVASQMEEQPMAQQGMTYRNLSDEELEAFNKKQMANDSVVFNRDGADRLFGMENQAQYQAPNPVNLGRYKDLGYYDIQLRGDEYSLLPTKRNPQNPDAYKDAMRYLQAQNPNIKFARDTYIAPVNRQEGGYTKYAQETGLPAVPDGLKNPNYTINTRYSSNVEGYTTEGSSILNQDYLENVENIQPYTGEGYGSKMSDVENTIELHKWYFDTEEKKNAFREAIKKKGAQPEVKAFQEAYNQEIEKRAKSAGLSEDEIKTVINQIGFTGSGVQKFDGKFGAFTSTRLLVNFNKNAEGKVEKQEIKPQPEQVAPAEEPLLDEMAQIPENRTKNVMPWLPNRFFLPPSPLDPVAKEQIALPRAEAIKMSAEPMLAEQERQRHTEMARVREMGLSPQQEAALTAQELATSQISANDAIGKVSTFNAQSQASTDQFNIGQTSKEAITNANLRTNYQDRVMQSMANWERDYRNYLTDTYLDNASKFKYIDETNWLNAKNENFQNIPGVGIQFINTQSADYSTPELDAEIAKLTPEQRELYKKEYSLTKSQIHSIQKAKGLI